MVCAIVELGSCSVFLAGNLSKLKLTPIRRLTIITDRLSCEYIYYRAFAIVRAYLPPRPHALQARTSFVICYAHNSKS